MNDRIGLPGETARASTRCVSIAASLLPGFGRFAARLFSSPSSPISTWRVIAWWELRRIPFNLIVGTYGTACLAVFAWLISTSGQLGPG